MFSAVAGLLLHLVGGVASGSFYVPLAYVQQWSWESGWLTAGVFSWLLVPPVMAHLTLPGYQSVIAEGNPHTLVVVFVLGLVWGVGSVFYGLGIRYLGMSLGNSYILGISSVCGSLLPAVYYDRHPTEGKVSLSDMVGSVGGKIVLLGLAIALCGIYLCGKSGVLKEQEQEAKQRRKAAEASQGLNHVELAELLLPPDAAGNNAAPTASSSSRGDEEADGGGGGGADVGGERKEGRKFWLGLASAPH